VPINVALLSAFAVAASSNKKGNGDEIRNNLTGIGVGVV
jgi:hypothetical protein